MNKKLVVIGTVTVAALTAIALWAFVVSPFLFPGGYENPLYFLRMILSFVVGGVIGNRSFVWGKAWHEAWENRERGHTATAFDDYEPYVVGDQKAPEKKNFWNRRWM